MRISIPDASGERPRFGQIGVIVGVCFGIGVVWPFLAGIELVPRAPVEKPEPAEDEAAPSAEPKRGAPAPAGAAPADKLSTQQRVAIEKSVVVSCHDKQGKRRKTCDHPDLGDTFPARIQNLANCPAAQGLSGVLSLGVEIDFKAGKFGDIAQGKSTTLPKAKTGELLDCARREFKSAAPQSDEHEHPKYEIYYLVEFIPPGTPIDDPHSTNPTITPASGTATVVFESAMIREQASEDAKVNARLLYGTRVYVTGKLDDWYEVKYDSKGRKGWVHKNAIGMQ